jgi:hypothetical protein
MSGVGVPERTGDVILEPADVVLIVILIEPPATMILLLPVYIFPESSFPLANTV